MNALARHLADAIAETAEEHLPKLDQTAYFHVKKALESAAQHVATVLEHENEAHRTGCLEAECEWPAVDSKLFLEACCIGKVK